MPSAPPMMQPELIDVRSEERFDEPRLAEWLSGRLEGSEQPLRVRQFGGGHANLTYLLCYGEGEQAREYVLRRPPLGPVEIGRASCRERVEVAVDAGARRDR